MKILIKVSEQYGDSQRLTVRYAAKTMLQIKTTDSQACTFFYHGATAPVGQGLFIIEDSRSHSDTPHLVELLWTSYQPDAQRHLSDNTVLTTNNHVPRGIQTQNPSERAAADPHIRPRGHWDRANLYLKRQKQSG
jgi:hypothetical protein